jgi:hypothetical protein
MKFSRPDSAKSSTERAILHNSRHNHAGPGPGACSIPCWPNLCTRYRLRERTAKCTHYVHSRAEDEEDPAAALIASRR